MKRLILVLSTIIGSLALGSPAAAAADPQVQMVNCSTPPGWCFSPAALTVPAGSSVTWTNNSSAPHTATSDTGGWSAGTLASPIAPPSSGTVTFSTAGTFLYHCALHPNMHGTIAVTAVVVTPSPSIAAAATPSVRTNPVAGRLGGTGGGSALPSALALLIVGAFLVGLGLALRRKGSH